MNVPKRDSRFFSTSVPIGPPFEALEAPFGRRRRGTAIDDLLFTVVNTTDGDESAGGVLSNVELRISRVAVLTGGLLVLLLDFAAFVVGVVGTVLSTFFQMLAIRLVTPVGLLRFELLRDGG